ncbi:MAG: ATP-binding protein [Alphaproteobacteria bacterium]|nr:ATP-binding protein [Alphaproteobacteria bacterium]
MFLSLNKKFFLTILAFFLLSAGIFAIIFNEIIGKKISEEHSSIVSRNQYVIDILNENIMLRKKLNLLAPQKIRQIDGNLDKKQEELSKERKLNEELNQNYNESYATLAENLKIISLGSILTLMSLVILWFLLRRWVITPIDKLILLSVAVANGDFSKRLKTKPKHFTDEFNTLMTTINFMLDNIENNINNIKEKEVFLQNLIDALPDAVRIIDDDYNIILSNKAYNEHIKKQYLFNKPKCYETYDKEASCPCSSAQYICPIKELKQKHSNNIKLIHYVNNRPLSINSARVFLNGKQGIVESIRDLSENVHFSHQQKISSLGFLATSLAHEMKNNLGAINLILDGLLQKYYPDTATPSEKQKYLTLISQQIKECIKVPERLLKLSRNTDQPDNDFNIASNISDILSLLDYEIKNKGINLIKNFSNLKENLCGNETDFKMIILNLVQNAINAMPNGGTLEVKTNTAKDKLIIDIKDTGCGISEKDLKHIFEPFYSTATTKNKKGTGLGLAIVKDLTAQFNAQITVSSHENQGTAFQIVFPRQKT